MTFSRFTIISKQKAIYQLNKKWVEKLEKVKLGPVFKEIFRDEKLWQRIKTDERLIGELPINLGDSKKLWDGILKQTKESEDKTIKVLAVAEWQKLNFGPDNRMCIFHSKEEENLALIRKQIRKYSHVRELKRESRSGKLKDMKFFFAFNTDKGM